MTIPEEQAEVAAFLSSLAGQPARETHISAVFIGPDTVWKLKKAVRLPFLDFSALAQRRHFLLRELELNKPAAPGIYRDVVAVGRLPDGRLALGQGEPVDWVLRMAPVPADDFLDTVAAQHHLTSALLDALGDAVSRYHARLEPVVGWDSVGSMRRIADGNAASAERAGLPADRVAGWRGGIEAEIERTAPDLGRRAAAGFVRRCHGDLHLGNLCLWDGVPVAFDALEFDEALATIDTAYDLAFLLMDLDLKAGRAAANRVMNRYVARTGDIGIVAALGLFLSQRAFIRAHVLRAMGQDAAAEAHLGAAEGYLRPGGPVIVAIGGLQGTGKSTLARLLAPDLGSAPGALIVRSDEVRKRLFHVAPEERLPPDAYSDDANARTNTAVIAQVIEAAGYGHSVVANSTFLDTGMRDRLQVAAETAGVRFVGVWLEAPLPVLEQRILARRHDASDATVGVLRAAVDRGIGAGSWHPVDAADQAAALAAVRRLIDVCGTGGRSGPDGSAAAV